MLPANRNFRASADAEPHLEVRTIAKIVKSHFVNLNTLRSIYNKSQRLRVDTQGGSIKAVSNNRSLYNFSGWLCWLLLFMPL